jgi:hypothetical protein
MTYGVAMKGEKFQGLIESSANKPDGWNDTSPFYIWTEQYIVTDGGVYECVADHIINHERAPEGVPVDILNPAIGKTISKVLTNDELGAVIVFEDGTAIEFADDVVDLSGPVFGMGYRLCKLSDIQEYLDDYRDITDKVEAATPRKKS